MDGIYLNKTKYYKHFTQMCNIKHFRYNNIHAQNLRQQQLDQVRRFLTCISIVLNTLISFELKLES